jgi:hypothetical protein
MFGLGFICGPILGGCSVHTGFGFLYFAGAAQGVAAQGVASIQTTKKIVFCPANRRLEAFGTMKADFLMRRIGNDARGFQHNN